MKKRILINLLASTMALTMFTQLFHSSAVEAGIEAEDFVPLPSAITELYKDEWLSGVNSKSQIIITYNDISFADKSVENLAAELRGYRVSRLEATSFGSTRLAESRRADAIKRVSGYKAENLGVKSVSINQTDSTQVITVSKADDADLAISILSGYQQVLWAMEYSAYLSSISNIEVQEESPFPKAAELLESGRRYSDLSDLEKERLRLEYCLREDTMSEWDSRGFTINTSWKKALIMQVLEISADEVLEMIESMGAASAFGDNETAYEQAMEFDSLHRANLFDEDLRKTLTSLLLQGYDAQQTVKAHIMSLFLEMPIEDVIWNDVSETDIEDELLQEVCEKYAVNPEVLIKHLNIKYEETPASDTEEALADESEEPSETDYFADDEADTAEAEVPEQLVKSEKEQKEAAKQAEKEEKEAAKQLEKAEKEAAKQAEKEEKEEAKQLKKAEKEELKLFKQLEKAQKEEAVEEFIEELEAFIEEDQPLAIMAMSVGIMAMSATTTDPEEPNYPNAPFGYKASENENIALNTGSLSYTQPLATLPGPAGHDFNLTLRFDTDMASDLRNAYLQANGNNYQNAISTPNEPEFSHRLVTGWSFAMSRLRIDTVNGHSHSPTSVTFADGRTYGAKPSGIANQFTIINYNLNDVKLSPANNTITDSKFKLEYADGKIEYFNLQGRLIAIHDRFGNRINISYTGGNPAMIIKQESSGQSIEISNSTNNYTIKLPDNSIITLNKITLGGRSVLGSIVDQENYKTDFEYDYSSVSYNHRTHYFAPVIGTAYYLTSIKYPTGAKTVYNNDIAVGRVYSSSYPNFQGNYEYYRVTERYDMPYSHTTYNKETYTYSSNNFTGTNATGLLALGYTYTTTVSNARNKTIYTFNYIHQKTNEAVYSGNNLLLEKIYDYATIGNLPYDVQTKFYNGSITRSFTELYSYDSIGNVIKYTDPHRNVTDYSYSHYNQLSLVIYRKVKDNTDVNESYSFDASGKYAVSKIVYTGTYGNSNQKTYAKTEYTRAGNGNLTRLREYHSDNSFYTTYFYYDATTNGSNVIFPANILPSSTTGRVAETWEYDAMGRVTRHVQDGVATEYRYDKIGRLTREIYFNTNGAENSNVQYSYLVNFSQNNLTVTDENNEKTSYSYDSLGNIIQISKNNTALKSFVYNNFMELRESHAAGKSSAYTYDALGRVLTHTSGTVVTNYEYKDAVNDAFGSLPPLSMVTKTVVGETNAPSQTTKYYYDNSGRLVREGIVTTNGEQVNIYAYDVLGNMTNATRRWGGYNESNTYDLLGRPETSKDALGNTVRYNYDMLGRTTKVIDPIGTPANYEYNAKNQLNKESLAVYTPDDQLVEYKYGNGGVLTEKSMRINEPHLSENISKTKYNYDPRGRLLTSHTGIGNIAQDVQFENNKYNAAGRLVWHRNGGDNSVAVDTNNAIYRVSYNGNGTNVSVPVDGNYYKINKTAKVKDKGNLLKKGYTFTGWNTKADGSGLSYQPDDYVTIIGNITLYAIWQEISTNDIVTNVDFSKPLSGYNGLTLSDSIKYVSSEFEILPLNNPISYYGKQYTHYLEVYKLRMQNGAYTNALVFENLKAGDTLEMLYGTYGAGWISGHIITDNGEFIDLGQVFYSGSQFSGDSEFEVREDGTYYFYSKNTTAYIYGITLTKKVNPYIISNVDFSQFSDDDFAANTDTAVVLGDGIKFITVGSASQKPRIEQGSWGGYSRRLNTGGGLSWANNGTVPRRALIVENVKSGDLIEIVYGSGADNRKFMEQIIHEDGTISSVRELGTMHSQIQYKAERETMAGTYFFYNDLGTYHIYAVKVFRQSESSTEASVRQLDFSNLTDADFDVGWDKVVTLGNGIRYITNGAATTKTKIDSGNWSANNIVYNKRLNTGGNLSVASNGNRRRAIIIDNVKVGDKIEIVYGSATVERSLTQSINLTTTTTVLTAETTAPRKYTLESAPTNGTYYYYDTGGGYHIYDVKITTPETTPTTPPPAPPPQNPVTITYTHGGATSGTVPKLDKIYGYGETLKLPDNIGNLSVVGEVFDYWCVTYPINDYGDEDCEHYYPGESFIVNNSYFRIDARFKSGENRGGTSYIYDSLGYVKEIIYADGESEYFVNAVDGLPTQKNSRNGGITTYSYNSNRQLTEIKVNGKAENTYKYYDNGLLKSEENGNVKLEYEYDILHNVIKETQTIKGTSITTIKETPCDLRGKVKNLKLTVNNVLRQNIGYIYDDAGRLINVKDGGIDGTDMAKYTFNQKSQPTVAEYYISNGIISRETQYNLAGQPTKDNYSNMHNIGMKIPIREVSYSYTLSGNMSQRADRSGTMVYNYDKQDRLTSETGANANRVITYNNDKLVRESVKYQSSSRADEITTDVKGATTWNGRGDPLRNGSYTFDINGNRVTHTRGVNSMSFGYDEFNRLISVNNIYGMVINNSYTYRTDSLMLSKKSGTNTTYFIWHAGQIICELNQNGTVIDNYYYGLQRIKSDRFGYYLHDAHGDVIALVNSLASVTKEYKYDANGNEVNPVATDLNPFRYTGEYFDKDVSFYYLRARWYDPLVGEFLTEDPIKDGHNWYKYCNDNPIKYIDPTGMFAVPWSTIVENVRSTLNRMNASNNSKENDEIVKITSGEGFYNVIYKNGDVFTVNTTIGKLKFSYRILYGWIEFDFSKNDYESALLAGAEWTLAKAMLNAAKEINPDYLSGRTVGGIVFELNGHYVPAKPLGFLTQTWDLLTGQTVHDAAIRADIGGMFEDKPGYDTNAALFESMYLTTLTVSIMRGQTVPKAIKAGESKEKVKNFYLPWTLR